MITENKHLILEEGREINDKSSWRSPSNIAIIKYWGKHGVQLPRNPSLSFTLSNAHTNTTISYQRKADSNKEISLKFLFEGQRNEIFESKVSAFLEKVTPYFPFLTQLDLEISSENSFPHSSGIASSASSMSALSLGLCDIEKRLFNSFEDDNAFLNKASFISRLGSGSACRSVYPKIGVWGVHSDYSGSSDQYAIPYIEKVHEIFTSFHDDILIVSKKEKEVSSRAGHALMEGNPYAIPRYAQANSRMSELKEILESGDLSSFGTIAESEALTLHALMMCSNPSYMLIKEGTLSIINKVYQYRKADNIPLYFTLDAGPNVHLLYPQEYAVPVGQFIESELTKHCEDGKVIKDFVGMGPQKLS